MKNISFYINNECKRIKNSFVHLFTERSEHSPKKEIFITALEHAKENIDTSYTEAEFIEVMSSKDIGGNEQLFTELYDYIYTPTKEIDITVIHAT